MSDKSHNDFKLWAVHNETGELFNEVTVTQSGSYSIMVKKEGTYTVYCKKDGCLPQSRQTEKMTILIRNGSHYLQNDRVDFINPTTIPVPSPILVVDTKPLEELDISRTNSVTLTSTATGYGTKYKWYFRSDTRELQLVGNSETLVIDNITVGQAGIYTCEISNEGGVVTKEYIITVNDSLFLEFRVGWNLISITRNIDSRQFAKVSALGQFWAWTGTHYKKLAEQEENRSMTFWVHSNNDDSIEVYGQRTDDHLDLTTPGWQLCSVNETRTVVLEDFKTIYAWDADLQVYAAVKMENDEVLLEEGKGYWIFNF